MAVTLERVPITSQLTFDSYVADWAALALRLMNELATTHAKGRENPPVTAPEKQTGVIRLAITEMGRADRADFGVADAAVVTQALARLRSAVDKCIDGDLSGAAVILNEVMADSQARPNLHDHPGHPMTFAFHGRGQPPGQSVIADMAASVALILGSGREARLGRCSATKCDQVFYDITRNASRRFCELSCQNRAKAVAYRARQAN